LQLDNYYAYTDVTRAVACRELGVWVDEVPDDPKTEENESAAAFNALVPFQPPDDQGRVHEHQFIGNLRAGVPLNRAEWDFVKADAALRALIGQAKAQIQEPMPVQ